MHGLRRVAHPACEHAGNPILVPEHPWEEHAIQLYGNAVFHDASCDRFRMYYLAHSAAKGRVFRRRTGEPMPSINFAGETKPAIVSLPAYAESRDGFAWQRVMMQQANYEEHATTNLLRGIVKGQCFEPGILLDPDDSDPNRRYKCVNWDMGASYPPAGTRRIRPAALTPSPEERSVDTPHGIFLGRPWQRVREGVVEILDDAGRVIHTQPEGLHQRQTGLYPAVSADGIHWQRLTEQPALHCYSDTGHSLLRDPVSGRLVCFGRMRFPDAFPQFEIGRAVARSESDDLIDWSTPEMVLIGDPGDPAPFHVNEMPVGLYEGLYLGVLEVGDGDSPAQRPDGPMQLACSRDGRRWHRVADRADFLTAAVAPDGWSHGCHLKPGSAPVPFGDHVLLYYSARATSAAAHCPRNGFGVATWRRDGFVSLHGDGDGGELLTTPFTFDGTALHLNLTVETGGAAQVTVCDQHGRPDGEWSGLTDGTVRSRTITGDHLDLEVAWESGRIEEMMGLPCTLRVKMQRTHLYSFWTE